MAACDKTEVKEEQIEKGIEQIPASQPDDRPEAQPEQQPTVQTTEESPSQLRTDPGFPWMVPSDWKLDETPRQMRIATYMAPTSEGDQEVAVTRFPGRVGGELANINRWRGQMGLSPINESELEENIERFTSDGFDGYQLRIESDRGAMLTAAVFDESTNQTWFVRTTLSNADLADQLESDVFDMARSIMQ